MTEEFEVDIEQIKKQLDEARTSYEDNTKEVNEVKIQLAEIAKQYDLISREKMRLEREHASKQQDIRELEKQYEKAKRLAAVKDEQERLAKEFSAKAKQLDELTATAKWREFAFDHQIEGGKRLAVAKRGILGDKRGLGKTLTSLIWGDMVQAKRVLVIAPNDVVPQFEDEIRTWAPARVIFPLRGLPKSQRDMIYPMLRQVDEFIITINYEAWRRDKSIIDDLVAAGIDTIICDEAHRIKASDKQTARGVFQIAYRPNFCSACKEVKTAFLSQNGTLYTSWMDKKKGYLVDFNNAAHAVCPDCLGPMSNTVENVLCMTGTPILNKPQELFSMLYLVSRDKFPSESKFLSDYCYNAGGGKWRFYQGGLGKLTKYMSEFFLQRNRDDAGIHVPPPAITIHNLEKDVSKYSKQYEAERMIHERAQLMLENGLRKDIFFVLELILRERQAMTWPAGISIKVKDPESDEVLEVINFDVEESQKLDAATELLSELMEEEERVIVFSQFKAPLYEMERRLRDQGIQTVMATGDQPQYLKEQVREDFDLKYAPTGKIGSADGPRYQVCFATFKAFGTGVNLNAARHIIMLDDEWNPGMEDQAIGRIDRMNSVDQANVHIFRVKSSIDDFMAALLEEKRGITEGFNESIGMAELMNFFK